MKGEQTVQDGFWWLPANPENRIAGRIQYSATDGAELDLVGSLSPINQLPHVTVPFDVWGTTVSGREITLFRAYQASAQLHVPGIPTMKVAAFRGVVGKHYEREEAVIVRNVTCELDYLTEWAGQTGITQSFDPPPSRTVRIAVNAPAIITLGEVNGITIKAVPIVNQQNSTNGVTLRDYCQLHLEPDKPRPLQDLEPVIVSMQKLLTLAVGEPCHTSKVQGKIPEELFRIENQPIWREIEIIRQVRRPESLEKIDRERMLFSLPDLLPEPNRVVQAFFAAEQRLSPVFELFFPTYFFADMPAPQEFLNLAHAIEAFHRLVIGGQYQSNDEYRNGLQQTFRSAIPSAIAGEFRQSLETKLQYLHEYSLRKRLKDVLKRFETVVAPYVGDHGKFVDRVAEARNRLVHASIEKPMPDYGQLWDLAHQLAIVLEIAILSEIGFESDRIRTVIARGKRAALIRNNIRI